MKKHFLIAAIIALVSTPVLALDVTAGMGHNAGTGLNVGSLSFGEQIGQFRSEVSVSADRATQHNYTVGIAGSVPLYTTPGGITFAPKAGLVYTDTGIGANGFGLKAGVEATYALSPNVSLVGEVAHVHNESALRAFNGNIGMVGVRYNFK